MQNISQRKALEESKKCFKLYPGSKDLETMISLFYKAKDLFKEQKQEAFLPADVSLSPEEIGVKFKKAEKLLPSAYFDGELVLDFLALVCAGISSNNPGFKDPLENLQSAVKNQFEQNDNKLSLNDLPDLVEKLVETVSVERDFVTFLLVFILSSLYCAPLEQFLQDLDTSYWEESDCPVCGVKPHYGFLQEESGEKWLECWFCGINWRYPRIKCPYCDNIEQEKLGFFTAENNEVCRVYFCRQCSKYHKVYDVRRLAEAEVLLFIHHLHTLHFDWLAQKEGFIPGSGLKWVEEKPDERVN